MSPSTSTIPAAITSADEPQRAFAERVARQLRGKLCRGLLCRAKRGKDLRIRLPGLAPLIDRAAQVVHHPVLHLPR